MKTPAQYTFIMTLSLVLLLALGCSKNSPLETYNAPCDTDSGLYAHITGSATPVDMCVPDNEIVGQTDIGVNAVYSPQSERYLITALFSKDGVTHEIDISFKIHSEKVTLVVTADEAQAQMDSGSVAFFYQITDASNKTYWSTAASGTFDLSYSDDQIAVGTFKNIELYLTDDASKSPSVVRYITEGYINVSADPL
jgi:hypothetical protein